VEKNCNQNGFCRPECQAVAERVKRHPCLQGDMKMLTTVILTTTHEGSQLLGRIHSCPDNTDGVDCSSQCADVCGWGDDVTDSATGSAAAVWLISLAFAVGRLINTL